MYTGAQRAIVDFEVHVEEYVSRRDRSTPSSSSRINIPHLYPCNMTDVKELGCVSSERSNVTHTQYTYRGTYEAMKSNDLDLFPFDTLGIIIYITVYFPVHYPFL